VAADTGEGAGGRQKGACGRAEGLGKSGCWLADNEGGKSWVKERRSEYEKVRLGIRSNGFLKPDDGSCRII
jgi:hypothetical protein